MGMRRREQLARSKQNSAIGNHHQQKPNVDNQLLKY
jgi:hypothetical protein